MQYLRFVYGDPIEDVGYRAGFLDAAYRLRNSENVPGYVQDQLTEAIDWFKANLAIPDRFNRSRSKGSYRRNTHGLSWFKPTAEEHIGRAHEVVAILEANGVVCDTIRTERVGYIVFEDEHQVIAEPFNETPT